VLLTEEIERSDQIYRESFDRLEGASDTQIGAEIVHQFLADLLGQTSTPAHVLRCKIEHSDFKRPMIVSLLAKQQACSLILLLDVAFITAAIVLSLRRSAEFQMQFLAVSFAHFVLNVAIFEVVECLMLQCVIPKLVSEDVSAALVVLVRTVETALTLSAHHAVSTEFGFVNISKSKKHTAPILNSPDYFFPSRRLAVKFSHLFESFLVAVFLSIQPSGKMRATKQTKVFDTWHAALRMSNAVAIFKLTVRKLGE